MKSGFDVDLYATEPWHAENNAAVMRALEPFGLNLFQPNPEKAPWHVQAKVDHGYEVILLNFWPHTCKAQREGEYSVCGVEDIVAMVKQAILDAAQPAPSLIE